MTNTNIDEFKKFHKILIEAAPNGYVPCYFRCAMGGKDPYTRVGSWVKAQLTFDGAISWLRQGGNIGIAGLNDDPLVIIDIDDETITDYKKGYTLIAPSNFYRAEGAVPTAPTDNRQQTHPLHPIQGEEVTHNE